jgi:hypothetical protein
MDDNLDLIGKNVYIEYDFVSEDEFISIKNRKLKKKYRGFVTNYTAEQYREKGCRLFVSKSKKCGFGVTHDGEIISVFSGETGKLKEILHNAKKAGGDKLYCIGNELVQKYSENGFEVFDFNVWVDSDAPDVWNYEEFGRPNIYFMKLNKLEKEKYAKSKNKL